MDYLIDTERKENRFKIKSLLVSGDHYQVALVEDTSDDYSDEKPVLCAKSIAYDDEFLNDPEYIENRHQALKDELEFLKLGIKGTPEPVQWLHVKSEEEELDVEPVLVVEFFPGHTLEQIVEVEGPMEPEQVRLIAVDLIEFLKECHDNGWVFRNLHPSHIVYAADGSISMIGCGNATKRGRPANLSKRIEYQAYLAPEIRDEVGGSTLQPPADLYTFGALLSYLLTAEHPRDHIENPLTETAYQALVNLKPEGLALIVAKCMAPMAKNRFAVVDELIPYLQSDSLPTPTTPGFGMVLLPAPWSGAEHPETNRALQSKISAGPLISVPEGGKKSRVQPRLSSLSARTEAIKEHQRIGYPVVMTVIILFLAVILGFLVFFR